MIAAIFILIAQALTLADPAWLVAKQKSTSAPSYLIEEYFEGTGAPTGWSTSTVDDYDYTNPPAPLQGSESWYNPSYRVTASWAPVREIWAFEQFYPTLLGSERYMFVPRLGGIECSQAYLNSSGSLILYHGTKGVSAGTYASNTLYYVWYNYVASDIGVSNGVAQLFLSTTPTRPASATLTITDGRNTNFVDRMAFTGLLCIYDSVVVSTNEITGVP